MASKSNGIDDALKRRNLMIPEHQYEHLRALAYAQRRSISELVREALTDYLANRRTA